MTALEQVAAVSESIVSMVEHHATLNARIAARHGSDCARYMEWAHRDDHSPNVQQWAARWAISTARSAWHFALIAESEVNS